MQPGCVVSFRQLRKSRGASSGRHCATCGLMRRSKIGGSLDHFVGECKQRWWNFEAECASGWQVDDKVELCRLYDRQIGGLLPFEDAPHIDTKLTVGVRYARAVAH